MKNEWEKFSNWFIDFSVYPFNIISLVGTRLKNGLTKKSFFVCKNKLTENFLDIVVAFASLLTSSRAKHRLKYLITLEYIFPLFKCWNYYYYLFLFFCMSSSSTGCRLRSFRITSSKGSKCNSIIITIIIINQIIIRIFSEQLDLSHHLARSRPTPWQIWQMTRPCIKIHLFFLQTASTWTCISSHLEVHVVECTMATVAAEIIINSMAAMTLCSLHLAISAPRLWISNRISAKFQINSSRNNKILNQQCQPLHRHRI